MMPSFIVLHPLQLPARRDLSRPHITKDINYNQQIIARLSILILSKTYPSVIATSPTLDMRGFLVGGVFLLNSNKEYVLTFKILAQILVDYSFLNEQAIASISCAIQLIKYKYSQSSIIRDIMASWISSLR
jgi:hypothetical protein